MSDDSVYHPNVDNIHVARQFAITLGVISVLFSGSVVFILLYKYNKLVRGRSFIHWVLVIAICDTVSSFCISLGYPCPGTFTCASQSFLIFFSSRASWLFTDVLIFQLFYVVYFKKYYLSIKRIHIIVWSINLLLQILPFTTNSMYGEVVDDIFIENSARCYIVPSNGTDDFTWSKRWVVYSFDLILVLSCSFVVVFTALIVYKSRMIGTADQSNLAPKMQKVFSTLILYPIGIYHHHQ